MIPVIFLIIGSLFLFGCSGKIDSEQSPALRDVSISSYNNGSEASQYVQVLLNFDRKITLGKKPLKNMHITISQERMKNISCRTRNDRQLCLKIKVTAVEKGTLVINEEKDGRGYPGILDKTGKYRVKDFQVRALIPAGVSLADVKSGKTSVVKKVKGTWNIRNITWLELTENGQPVKSRLAAKKELLNNAVAVHGHDFLDKDSVMIAKIMADTLNRHFGDRYRFSSSGGKITGIRKNGAAAGRIDLKIYSYKHIER